MTHIKQKNLFFLGKGGTGKSTIAASTACALAEKGEKVAVISMDPAHNLFDIFEVESKKKEIKMGDRLIIEEIDVNYWIKSYLKSVENKIAQSYQHLTSLSLDKHIETLRYSPGLEEYALQYAFETIQKKYHDCRFILFDMPPTALALRFFNLPLLSIVWLEQLLELRKIILKKKKIVDEVLQKDLDRSGDKILKQLYEMNRINQDLIENWRNATSTGIYIVMNDDTLSHAESKDIYDMILKHQFNLAGILVNKYPAQVNREIKDNIFNEIPTFYIPLVNDPLLGIDRLSKFMLSKSIRSFVESILKNR